MVSIIILLLVLYKKFFSKVPIDQNLIVQTLLKDQLNIKDEQIKALTDAVKSLSEGKGTLASAVDIDLALQALAKGETTQAKAIFARVLEQKTTEGRQANQQAAAAARHLGALAFLDNTQTALNYYRQSTELEPDNAEGWNQLGILLLRIGKLDQAVAAYQKVFDLGKQQQNQMLLAVAYGNLGNVHQLKGDLKRAEDCYLQVIKIAKMLGIKESRGIANSYGCLGVIYEIKGDSTKAENHYLQSLEMNKILGNKQGMADSYSSLGNIYHARGDLMKAEEYHLQALEIDRTFGNERGAAINYGNLGIVYKDKGELTKAEEHHLQALKIFDHLQDKQGLISSYNSLGNIFYNNDNLTKAKDYYLKSLKESKDFNYKESMAINCNNLGNISKKLGEIEKAKKYYKESMSLFDELGNNQRVQKIQQLLDDLLTTHPNQNPE